MIIASQRNAYLSAFLLKECRVGQEVPRYISLHFTNGFRIFFLAPDVPNLSKKYWNRGIQVQPFVSATFEGNFSPENLSPGKIAQHMAVQIDKFDRARRDWRLVSRFFAGRVCLSEGLLCWKWGKWGAPGQQARAKCDGTRLSLLCNGCNFSRLVQGAGYE